MDVDKFRFWECPEEFKEDIEDKIGILLGEMEGLDITKQLLRGELSRLIMKLSRIIIKRLDAKNGR